MFRGYPGGRGVSRAVSMGRFLMAGGKRSYQRGRVGGLYILS